MEENHLKPDDQNFENTTQDLINASLIFGRALGLILKEKQGIVKIPFYYSEVSAGRGLSSMDSSYDYMFLDENWFKNHDKEYSNSSYENKLTNKNINF